MLYAKFCSKYTLENNHRQSWHVINILVTLLLCEKGRFTSPKNLYSDVSGQSDCLMFAGETCGISWRS